MASEKPFKNVAELIKFALVCAIRDREGYAACDPGPDGEDARQEAKAFRAYLRRRYQSRPASDALDGMPSISIFDLKVKSDAD